MKSKALSADRIWDCFKRQIWIFALVFLALLFGYIVSILKQFDSWENLSKLSNAEILVQYTSFIQSDIAGYGLMIFVIAALLNGIVGFWYLHVAKMADFYHCLPIRREKLYWNQTAAGFLAYVVPEIVVSLLLLCVGASKGFFTMKLVKALAGTVGLHILGYLLAYGTTILAMLLTGRILVGVLGGLAFLSYVPMLLALLAYYGQIFFTTFASENLLRSSLFRAVLGTSPVAWYTMVQEWRIEGESLLLPLAAGCLMIIVLFLFCQWIYQKRPSEAAGKAMVFAGFGKAVKFLVEIPAALGVGILAYRMAPANSHGLWWLIGVLLGLALTHGVMEVIYQADFKKFFAHRLELGAEAVLTALLAALFILDPFGYDNYLPVQENLVSIGVGGNLTNENKVCITKDEDGTWRMDYGTGVQQAQMKLPVDKELYNLLVYMRQNRIRFTWDGSAQQVPTYYLKIAFRLKNGKTVCRNYRLSITEDNREELAKLWQWQEFREGLYDHLEEKNTYTQEVRWENMGDAYTLYEENDPARFKILEALQQDIADSSVDAFMEDPVGMLTLDYGMGSGKEETYLGTEDFYVYSSYQRTLALLEEKEAGTLLHPDPQKVKSIRVYNNRDKENEISNEVVITNKKEIEEILPAVVNGNYGSFQIPKKETDISVSVETVDHYGNPMTIYGELLYIPKPVEKAVNEAL